MTSIEDSLPLISNIQLQFWSSVGVSALLIYDIIITWEEEVEYFWEAPLNPLNLCFLLMRYGAVIRSIIDARAATIRNVGTEPDFCAATTWFVSLFDWAIVLYMDYILSLRVQALYSFEARCKGVVLAIRFFFFCNAAITLGALIAFVLKEGVYTDIILGNAGFCGNKKLPVNLSSLYWSAVLLYDSILMSLALVKAAQIRKSLGFRGVELVKTLIFDQIAYFSLVIVVSITNIVTDTVSPKDQSALQFAVFIIGGAELLSLQGSRMLIRLRKLSKRRNEAGETYGMTSDVSNPEFRRYTANGDQRTIRYSWALGE